MTPELHQPPSVDKTSLIKDNGATGSLVFGNSGEEQPVAQTWLVYSGSAPVLRSLCLIIVRLQVKNHLH